MSEPRHYTGKCHRVIDGDTIVCDIDLGFYVWTRQIIRLKDVDTFELRGVSEEEKAKARKEKEFLQAIAEHEELKISVHGKGKYGRWIAEIFDSDGRSINEQMKIYHGVVWQQEK